MSPSAFDKLHPTSCASYRLRRAARLLARAYDAALAPTGLRNTQFTLLGALELEGPKNVTELADALGIEGSTLARNLEILRREKLIKNISKGSDARTKHITITPKGKAKFDAALPIWRKTQQTILSDVTNHEWLDMIDRLHGFEKSSTQLL